MPTPTFEVPSRESVTTIRSDGSRPYLYPSDTRGRFTRARQWTAGGLIVFYLALPWIDVNGYPAVFLDLAERRFHLLGFTLAAQDMWLLFFLISGLGFSLFFVTALLGRIWCGWACPHTVFLDHVYRRIEQWVEGNSVQRRLLDAAPLSLEKLTKRGIKHAAYLLVSAVITHLFLAYFVSLPEVWSMVRSAPGEHWAAFAFMMVSTAILYFNFAWFREQMCIVLCPYGRIQSALTDENSLVIGYDAARGEPRGKRRAVDQDAQAKLGDCVDCMRCVHVCPTGIDIRHGMQMECIGCTACIDACDEVMTRLKRPRGLIRYDSHNGFAGKATRWIRPRTGLYFALLLAGAIAASLGLSTVKPIGVTVTRMTGAPYIVDGETVRNQFLVRLVNKRNEPVQFTLDVTSGPANLQRVGFDGSVEVAPLGELVQPLILSQRREEYRSPFRVMLRVRNQTAAAPIERAVEFLGPDATLLNEKGRDE